MKTYTERENDALLRALCTARKLVWDWVPFAKSIKPLRQLDNAIKKVSKS